MRQTTSNARRPALGLALLALTSAACSEAPVDPPPAALVRELTGIDPDVAASIQAARTDVRKRSDGDAWGALGMTYQANRLDALARASYAMAAELDPTGARWPYLTAIIHAGKGLDEEAVVAFERALELDREYAPIHWRLGHSLLDLGRLPDAERAFRGSIRIDPSDPPAWIGLARVHLQHRDPDQALTDLEQALTLRPHDRYAHGLRGAALRMQERWNEARRELELARDAAPMLRDRWHTEMMRHRADTFQTRWADASTHFEAGRYAEALPLLEALRTERPEQIVVIQLLAAGYASNGRLDDARATYEACLELEPDGRAALVGLADTLGRLGQVDRGLVVIARALELHPHYGRAHHSAGVLKKRAGDGAAAIESFRRSIEHDGRNPATHLSLGYLELDLYRWSDAAESFEAAANMGLVSGELWVGLAKARLKLGDLGAATAALDRLASSPPRDLALLRQVRAELERRLSAKEGEPAGVPR